MNRVAHLLINLNHGGAEQLVLRWVRARLAESPGSTLVVTLDERGRLAEQLPEAVQLCLQARRGRKPWDQTAVSALRRFLRESKVDVLHSHNLAAHQYGVLATLGTPVAHVQTQHGANTHVHGRFDRWRSRILARLTDQMVAVSMGTARSMHAVQAIPEHSIKIIPNGVATYNAQTSSRSPDARDQSPPSNAFVFGSVGRLTSVKAWDRFLPRFAAFLNTLNEKEKASRPPLLLLIGDGEARPALQQQVLDLGLDQSVRFAGFQTHPLPWLNRIDVFLLPSHSEGLSVALLEALEAGCYAMVTDVGDCGLVVRTVGHGEILQSDSGEWPQQLRKVYTNPPERRVRALSESKEGRIYSETHCLQAYENLYHAVRRKPKACQ